MPARAFSYLGYYTWQQVGRWLRRKHHRATWKDLVPCQNLHMGAEVLFLAVISLLCGTR